MKVSPSKSSQPRSAEPETKDRPSPSISGAPETDGLMATTIDQKEKAIAIEASTYKKVAKMMRGFNRAYQTADKIEAHRQLTPFIGAVHEFSHESKYVPHEKVKKLVNSLNGLCGETTIDRGDFISKVEEVIPVDDSMVTVYDQDMQRLAVELQEMSATHPTTEKELDALKERFDDFCSSMSSAPMESGKMLALTVAGITEDKAAELQLNTDIIGFLTEIFNQATDLLLVLSFYASGSPYFLFSAGSFLLQLVVRTFVILVDYDAGAADRKKRGKKLSWLGRLGLRRRGLKSLGAIQDDIDAKLAVDCVRRDKAKALARSNERSFFLQQLQYDLKHLYWNQPYLLYFMSRVHVLEGVVTTLLTDAGVGMSMIDSESARDLDAGGALDADVDDDVGDDVKACLDMYREAQLAGYEAQRVAFITFFQDLPALIVQLSLAYQEILLAGEAMTVPWAVATGMTFFHLTGYYTASLRGASRMKQMRELVSNTTVTLEHKKDKKGRRVVFKVPGKSKRRPKFLQAQDLFVIRPILFNLDMVAVPDLKLLDSEEAELDPDLEPGDEAAEKMCANYKGILQNCALPTGALFSAKAMRLFIQKLKATAFEIDIHAMLDALENRLDQDAKALKFDQLTAQFEQGTLGFTVKEYQGHIQATNIVPGGQADAHEIPDGAALTHINDELLPAFETGEGMHFLVDRLKLSGWPVRLTFGIKDARLERPGSSSVRGAKKNSSPRADLTGLDEQLQLFVRLDSSGAAAKKTDAKGRLAIHRAAGYKLPKFIGELLGKHEDSAKASAHGSHLLPLHIAVEAKADLNTLLPIIDKHPGAARNSDFVAHLETLEVDTTSAKGTLLGVLLGPVLSVAALTRLKFKHEVIAAILHKGSKAARDADVKDGDNHMPLFYAEQHCIEDPDTWGPVVTMLKSPAEVGSAKSAIDKEAEEKERIVAAAFKLCSSLHADDAVSELNKLPADLRLLVAERVDPATGSMAVHFAAQAAHLPLAKALLETNPECAKAANEAGETPIAAAVANDAPLGVVKVILAAHPLGADDERVIEYVERLGCRGLQEILFDGLGHRQDRAGVFARVKAWDNLVDCLTENAEDARVEYMTLLPIDLAVERRATREAMAALLKAYAAGADDQAVEYASNLGIDSSMTLPRKCTSAMLPELFDMNPFALSVDASEADAVAIGGPEFIDVIMKHYRGTLHKLVLPSAQRPFMAEDILHAHKAWGRDTHLIFDLHSAIRNRDLSVEALEQMVRLDRMMGRKEPCTSIKDESMNLPIHRAAQLLRRHPEVVSALCKAHPEGAGERNLQDSLPVTLAVMARSNEAVVRELLEAYPPGAGQAAAAAVEMDESDNNRAVIREILRSDPTLLLGANALPALAARVESYEMEEEEYTAAWVLASRGHWGSARRAVDMSRNAAEEAGRADPYGRNLLHHACITEGTSGTDAMGETVTEVKPTGGAELATWLVTEVDPGLAAVTDRDGKLPVEYAVVSAFGRTAMVKLCHAYPGAKKLSAVNRHFMELMKTPGRLTELVKSKNWTELLECMPFPRDAASEQAAPEYKMPIEIAVEHDAPREVIEALIKIQPESITYRNFEVGCAKDNAAVAAKALSVQIKEKPKGESPDHRAQRLLPFEKQSAELEAILEAVKSRAVRFDLPGWISGYGFSEYVTECVVAQGGMRKAKLRPEVAAPPAAGPAVVVEEAGAVAVEEAGAPAAEAAGPALMARTAAEVSVAPAVEDLLVADELGGANDGGADGGAAVMARTDVIQEQVMP